MKEELAQVSVEAFKALMENLSQAKGFVLAQAPDVLQGMVLAARIESSIVASICLISFFFIFLGVFLSDKHADSDYLGMSVLAFFVFILSLLFGCHFFIVSWFAPKVYLLEHISGMLK